jgi:hypothetical protein
LSDSDLRGKNEPLKTYGIRLCEQGLRDTWLKYLKENIDGIIKKRRDALLERFPHAVFTDLSGKSYTIHDCRRKFRVTTLADTDNGAWYSKRIPSRQSPGVLDMLRELERGPTPQAIPLEADASVRTPSKPINPSYPLPLAAPRPQVERMSNWELFNSFCDSSNESETGEFLA